MITKERRARNDRSMDEWRMRNFAVAHEVKRQALKDNINHFEVNLYIILVFSISIIILDPGFTRRDP